jgi:hypothetical protein
MPPLTVTFHVCFWAIIIKACNQNNCQYNHLSPFSFSLKKSACADARLSNGVYSIDVAQKQGETVL